MLELLPNSENKMNWCQEKYTAFLYWALATPYPEIQLKPVNPNPKAFNPKPQILIT